MKRICGTLTATGTILALIAVGATAHAEARKRAPDPGLHPFSGCKSIKRHASRHRGALLPGVGDPGRGRVPTVQADGSLPGTSPAMGGAGGGSSGTNVQEDGVDEPDVVKSQGDRLFVVTAEQLVALETGPGIPRELGSLNLERRRAGGEGSRGLFLRGTRALVLHDSPRGLQIQEIDVSDPSAMRVTASMAVDGGLLDARLHDGVARVAIRSALDVPAPHLTSSARGRRNPVASVKPRSLLPRQKLIVSGRRSTGPLVPCRAVRRPGAFGGLEVMTVLTIDLDRGLPAVDSDAVLMNGETVYASGESLYVATGAFRRGGIGGPTEIHRFSLDGPATTYRASGTVPGTMLSQFSMSEHEGVLRVASTTEPSDPGRRRDSQSFVTTLAQDGGELVQVGQIGGLGRRERIQAVRFIEDTGYVVTFRRVDPLYTLDLSVPRAPRVLGELKVRGYSAYLHPAGDGRLIGVGQDATPDGLTKGTQVSLFDVSDPAAPSLLSRSKLGGDSSSAVELDHRAFLYWEPSSLIVIPASVRRVRAIRPSFVGAVAYRTGGGVQEVGRITHGDDPPPIQRTIVNSGRLVTVSDRGILVSDLGSLTPVGWVPLRKRG